MLTRLAGIFLVGLLWTPGAVARFTDHLLETPGRAIVEFKEMTRDQESGCCVWYSLTPKKMTQDEKIYFKEIYAVVFQGRIAQVFLQFTSYQAADEYARRIREKLGPGKTKDDGRFVTETWSTRTRKIVLTLDPAFQNAGLQLSNPILEAAMQQK